MKIHGVADIKSRKGREYLARRGEILRAGEKLFAERGFHGTTMLDLAKLSEFSVGSLYNFFETKEEVYYTLLVEKLDLFRLRLDGEVNRQPPGLAQIFALIESSVKFFQENENFFRILIQGRPALELSVGETVGKDLRERYLACVDFVANAITRAIKKGEIEKFNPLEMAYVLLGMLNSFVTYWTMHPGDSELGSKVPFIYDLFLKGVAKRRR